MRILILLISVSFSSRCPVQEYKIENYRDFEQQVNALEQNGEYEHAIQLTNLVWDHFPEKEFDLMKELIYLNFKTLRYEENLKLWSEGHKKGYFFLLNTRMNKYKPYIENEGFLKLVATDEKLRRASFEQSKTIYEIVLPDSFNPSSHYPLMMILHGGGSNLEKTRERWKITPMMQSEYIVVFLQSYRHMDYNTFGWVSSDERAHEDVRNCFEMIRDSYPVDSSRVTLCGMSAGGTMAFDLAFNHILPVHKIIAFCPGKPWNLRREMMNRNQPIVYMIGGESDYYLSKQEEMIQMFQLMKIKYLYKIVPGMSHEFPKQYELYMEEALTSFIKS